MKDIYQIMAGYSLDFYIENIDGNEELIGIVLDQDIFEVINKIAFVIEEKIKKNKSLIETLERFYEDEVSRAVVENIFMDIDLQEKDVNGIELFIALSSYVAVEETKFIVNEIIKRRG